MAGGDDGVAGDFAVSARGHVVAEGADGGGAAGGDGAFAASTCGDDAVGDAVTAAGATLFAVSGCDGVDAPFVTSVRGTDCGGGGAGEVAAGAGVFTASECDDAEGKVKSFGAAARGAGVAGGDGAFAASTRGDVGVAAAGAGGFTAS